MRRVDSRAGFTLIELLIVVVIIGILAGIAIPKFSSARDKAYLSAMQSDLRSLAAMQETYHSDNQTYAATTTALEFSTSEGVTIGAITSSGTGWSATATHSGSTATCAYFFGDAAAVSPATITGTVTCG